MNERTGKRRPRNQAFKRRVPELGYYLIVTDAEATEQNYIEGLKKAIPTELRERLVIKISESKTGALVEEARRLASHQALYSEPWIMFDRDLVQNFDQIIKTAQECGVRTAWSNPCIEIWFSAYFGTMPHYQNSTECCSGFGRNFQNKTGQKYQKNDREIYSKLCAFGDEKLAIETAGREYFALLKRGT